MKKIYLVGGAVRDKLLGYETSDKDYVAVGYTQDDFSYLKQVGKDFPVFITEDGDELALARTEKKVSTGYKGFSVDTEDITLRQDLERRDLTINSIAFDEELNIIIDPYGGQKDIEKKILRHTSQAFVEDPIRVLRLARLRARYGYEWKIYRDTKVLVYSMKDELKHLQPDRVYKEVSKVLELDNSHIFFETLFELGVLEDIFPSIYELTTLKEGSKYHLEANVFEHTMQMLKNISNGSPLQKLTAIYHDIAKPICYRTDGDSAGHEQRKLVLPLIDMQLPTKLTKRMLFLIENHIKIYILFTMKASKIATFFESFRKDRQLLIDLIIIANADNQGRIAIDTTENLDEELLLNIFDDIAQYSPKAWIDIQYKKSKVPEPEVIKQHIHNYNIGIVKKYLK
ncbi:MAG: polynucleotide adenylyltransferase [Campylobacterales bacterium]|nr:polynucleotide adenylyltransferase [Campylobacterales bacterium]